MKTIENKEYSFTNEIRIQKIISAIITSAISVIIFLTFILFYNLKKSLLMTIIFSFATPLVSTLSRALWSHTWLVLLLSIIILIILKNIKNKTLPNPYILATLVAWMYFVRPTSSISIIIISILCALYFKKIFLKYFTIGIFWLLAFITYSYYNFETVLPSYYLVNRLAFDNFSTAFIGNLFSPSRGLFVHCFFLIPIIFLTIKQKNLNEYKLLIYASFTAITLHLIIISSFPHWWGGHSYGPRFMSDIIPWLLAIAALSFNSAKKTNIYLLTILIITSGIGIFINTRGAYNPKTAEWNVSPDNIDSNPARLWDWKHPQFLAGVHQFSKEKTLPVLTKKKTIILFNSIEADSFLIDGWSHAESRFRWTEAKTARFGFNLDNIQPITISIKLEPFIKSDKNKQKIIFYINEKHLQEYNFESPGLEIITLNISEGHLKNKNIVKIKIPNATSPSNMHISDDQRTLGIAVYQIEIKK